MKTTDVMCSICGTINCGLILEETDGWMECEYCKCMSAGHGLCPIDYKCCFSLSRLLRDV